jgi:hypothetical protein
VNAIPALAAASQRNASLSPLIWCTGVVAIIAMTGRGAEQPTWGEESTKDLRDAMKKNKYEEVCAFYGTIKQAGIGKPAGPCIEIDRRASWSVVVSIEKVDKKADLLTAAEGQDVVLSMAFPHHAGIRKDDIGAGFYFVVWSARHNDVDYYTLTAIKRDGSQLDQFAPKAWREAEAAREPGMNGALQPQSSQPDYAKWEQIRNGMAEAEVRKILGEPLHDSGTPEEFRNDPTYVKTLTYGTIRYPSPALPGSFTFEISIKQGNVSEKYDPFNGELSKNGRPTTPIQTTPKDRTTLDLTRFVDLRWRPSSGEYPIVYVVQVETGQHAKIDGKGTLVYVSKEQHTTYSPYLALRSGGTNASRWRVMAANKKGQSAWTEWRYFRFEE